MSVARFFLTLSLLALVLTHTLALTAVRLRFELRRAEIARTLCQNRARPWLGCQGSCVLREELKTAADNTGGLLRLGADTLADLFLPAAPLTLPVALTAPEFWSAAPAWPRAPEARADAGFGRGLFRPPAPVV